MKNLTFVALSLLGSLCLFSCQKEIDFKEPTPPGGGGGTGGGTTTVNSYYPLTPGSWWKYKDSTSGTVSSNTATNVKKRLTALCIQPWSGQTAHKQILPGLLLRSLIII